MRCTKSVMMYGALGRKTSHTTNHPTFSIVEESFPIARAKNHAATAGTAARNRFQARNPRAREPDRANRKRSRAPHQLNSITKSSNRGACPPFLKRDAIESAEPSIDFSCEWSKTL